VVAAYIEKQKTAALRMLNLERRLMEKIIERKDVFNLSVNAKVSLPPLFPLLIIVYGRLSDRCRRSKYLKSKT
jgi:hypothetical protein